ncbi:MAG: DNA polymerase III subunit gamma/tau [Rudaea sp.]
MNQALYLKYRPRTFDEVMGQEHITQTLKSALRLGRIAHAYLFTGTRGTGKTSTARILAKAVNCLDDKIENRPCNKCAICLAINDERLLDLVEIDAASNTGVDNIRDLRDTLDFRPSQARYKVIIVDEAHMLSTSAFNALLKTLEEPPPHVIFVLATTEPNKLPATILSRCQRFDFRRATLDELIRRLSEISEKENLEIEPAALELIARQATGSFRDAASLLDQIMAFGGQDDGRAVTLEQVQSLLGACSLETIHLIVQALAERDPARAIENIGRAVDAGADPRQLSRDVVEYVRGVLLFQVGGGAALQASKESAAEKSQLAKITSPDQLLQIIRLFTQATAELKSSASPTLPLEMAAVESVLEGGSARVDALPPRRAVAQPVPRSTPIGKETAKPAAPRGLAEAEPPAKPALIETSTTEETVLFQEAQAAKPSSNELTLEAIEEQWKPMLSRVRRINKTTEAFLRDARLVALEGNVIVIGFDHDLHKKRVEDDKKSQAAIEHFFAESFAAPCRLRLVISPKKAKLKAAQDDPVIRAALDLGGKITDIS